MMPYSLRADDTTLVYAAPPLSMALEIETVEPAADTRAPSLCTCDEWNDFDHYERVTGESCATTVAGP